MKRSILAVAAVLALGSVSAYAQTANVLPSFNDAPDLDSPALSATVSTTDNAKSSASARDTTAQYAQSSHGATRSDAGSDASYGASSNRGFGAGSLAKEPAETLNDSFHYPTSN
jgi:hypothetical protein